MSDNDKQNQIVPNAPTVEEVPSHPEIESETPEKTEVVVEKTEAADKEEEQLQQEDSLTEIANEENEAANEEIDSPDNTPAGEETAELEEEVEEKNHHPDAKWYVVHTYSGHENRVATSLKQKIESERLENKIFDILVPTQDKIEIRSGKKETVAEKIFPGYLLVKMLLDDNSWLAVRTTPGVTAFVGIGNKPTPIPEAEVKTIVKFMNQGASPTFKDVFLVNDTVKIVDGPFADFIGKVDSVDKERGKVRVLVSIFGRETPVELDFLQVAKL